MEKVLRVEGKFINVERDGGNLHLRNGGHHHHFCTEPGDYFSPYRSMKINFNQGRIGLLGQ